MKNECLVTTYQWCVYRLLSGVENMYIVCAPQNILLLTINSSWSSIYHVNTLSTLVWEVIVPDYFQYVEYHSGTTHTTSSTNSGSFQEHAQSRTGHVSSVPQFEGPGGPKVSCYVWWKNCRTVPGFSFEGKCPDVWGESVNHYTPVVSYGKLT